MYLKKLRPELRLPAHWGSAPLAWVRASRAPHHLYPLLRGGHQEGHGGHWGHGGGDWGHRGGWDNRGGWGYGPSWGCITGPFGARRLVPLVADRAPSSRPATWMADVETLGAARPRLPLLKFALAGTPGSVSRLRLTTKSTLLSGEGSGEGLMAGRSVELAAASAVAPCPRVGPPPGSRVAGRVGYDVNASAEDRNAPNRGLRVQHRGEQPYLVVE